MLRSEKNSTNVILEAGGIRLMLSSIKTIEKN